MASKTYTPGNLTQEQRKTICDWLMNAGYSPADIASITQIKGTNQYSMKIYLRDENDKRYLDPKNQNEAAHEYKLVTIEEPWPL